MPVLARVGGFRIADYGFARVVLIPFNGIVCFTLLFVSIRIIFRLPYWAGISFYGAPELNFPFLRG
jgi:hypothetical protein